MKKPADQTTPKIETVRFTLDMPPHLHRAFKMAAVSEGKSMRALALQWIHEGVDEINHPKK